MFENQEAKICYHIARLTGRHCPTCRKIGEIVQQLHKIPMQEEKGDDNYESCKWRSPIGCLFQYIRPNVGGCTYYQETTTEYAKYMRDVLAFEQNLSGCPHKSLCVVDKFPNEVKLCPRCNHSWIPKELASEDSMYAQ